MADTPAANPLAGLLSDPGALASLMQMAQGLFASMPAGTASGSGTASGVPASESQGTPEADTANPEAPPAFVPDPIQKREPDGSALPVGAFGLPSGIPGLHAPANRNRDALLCALKPYLAPARAERLDRILRMWQLAQMLGTAKRYL